VRTHNIKSIANFGLVAMFGVILSGCESQPFQAYNGPRLPRQRVAVLTPNEGVGAYVTNTDIAIIEIDGTYLNTGTKPVALLPGTHRISFVQFKYHQYGHPIVEYVNVQAGQAYRASKVDSDVHDVPKPDQFSSTSTPGGTWAVDIRMEDATD
jgi:hypothetical protein